LRLPMTPITDSGRETVRAALKHAGLPACSRFSSLTVTAC
ncbi:hypothetical protein, partial [Escherichia coli]